MTQIRPLHPTDFPEWLPLWNGNNLGQTNEAITTSTWTRLIDEDSPVHGLCAVNGNTLVGIVQYVLHPTTGAIDPVCYMQDVYVASAHRGKGIGRKLVKALAAHGKKENWNRMYWLAESSNEPAQALYKTLGIKLDFTLHVLPIGSR